MANGLFRTEALLFSNRAGDGEAVFYQPWSVKALVLLLMGIFACFLAFACFAEISRTERVRGYLNPANGLLKVLSPRQGVISMVHVKDGDVVLKGDVLMTVSDTLTNRIGGRVTDDQLVFMDEQIAVTRRRIEVRQHKAALDALRLEGRMVELAREHELLAEELRLISLQTELMASDYEKIAALNASGQTSMQELRQARMSLYQLQQQGKSAERQLTVRESSINDVQASLELLPAVTEEDVQILRSQLTQLLSQRYELATSGEFSIVAPADGVVDNLLLQTGDRLQHGATVMSVSPVDNELLAWMFLPSKSRAGVAAGQKIRISYDAYPYQTYGSFIATVEAVSNTAMDPRDYRLPVDLREPVFLVQARLDSPDGVPDSAASAVNLHSGMQFFADVVTGQQTVLKKIFKPLSDLGQRL